MTTSRMILAASVFALAGVSAQAAQHDQNETGAMPQANTPMQGMMDQSGQGSGNMAQGGSMMSQGGTDHPMMLKMMMAMIDTDGSGGLSLEEVQAVHARVFGMADTDADGQLSRDEIRSFMTGSGMMSRSGQ
ncbi:EF-hand domain-containing protein [uncultured Paracoccus sp.]|uniref:EF-hand domain-containing protein n=1 Tax=uncultured Paracoccus sp. TaxID=189685 RepID=UPI00262D38D5|nr:EF-hand domain-containing protein [uncultured Paracoccus sp.]